MEWESEGRGKRGREVRGEEGREERGKGGKRERERMSRKERENLIHFPGYPSLRLLKLPHA